MTYKNKKLHLNEDMYLILRKYSTLDLQIIRHFSAASFYLIYKLYYIAISAYSGRFSNSRLANGQSGKIFTPAVRA